MSKDKPGVELSRMTRFALVVDTGMMMITIPVLKVRGAVAEWTTRRIRADIERENRRRFLEKLGGQE